ncbi:alpha/beta hydrolase fold domain-containing protein [Actinoplanes sp. NPDC049548]|uniref:alpha/beta hydrolase n=1 Tax=Actinoplanes sp. NPDC049548 TaxID=3155152 RepID=UPI003432B079
MSATPATAPSWQHAAVVRALRLVRANRILAPGRVPKPNAPARRRRLPPPPPWTRRGVQVERSAHLGWPMWTLRSARRPGDGAVVVALHGGAYVREITAAHYGYYADLVRRTGSAVMVPGYPLAPAGTAGTVVPAVADLLTRIIAEHGPAAVRVLGDSAGGGLALAAVQELRRRGALVPGRLVLLSPWLDVTLSDARSATVADPMLDLAGMRACGRLWAGRLSPTDPMVSPLFGPLDGLPPTTVYAGTLDLLHPDAVRLREGAGAAGSEVRLELRTGLLHDWLLVPMLPEARRARGDIHRLLARAG